MAELSDIPYNNPVLIVPLWNWNGTCSACRSTSSCFNCTFMELKSRDECIISWLSVLYALNGRKVPVWILIRYEKVRFNVFSLLLLQNYRKCWWCEVINVLMEEVKNIGKVVGCLMFFFWKKSLKVSFFGLKIFVIHWLIGVYNKWYFLYFVTKSIIKVS